MSTHFRHGFLRRRRRDEGEVSKLLQIANNPEIVLHLEKADDTILLSLRKGDHADERVDGVSVRSRIGNAADSMVRPQPPSA